MDYTLDEENAAAEYYDSEEDYRTFQYLGKQMKVKRQQAEAAYMMTCTVLLDSMVN